MFIERSKTADVAAILALLLAADVGGCRPQRRSSHGQMILTMITKLDKHGSDLRVWVELRGFEPLTPSMRTRCATGLRYSPKTGSQRSKHPHQPGPPARSQSHPGTRGPATGLARPTTC